MFELLQEATNYAAPFQTALFAHMTGICSMLAIGLLVAVSTGIPTLILAHRSGIYYKTGAFFAGVAGAIITYTIYHFAVSPFLPNKILDIREGDWLSISLFATVGALGTATRQVNLPVAAALIEWAITPGPHTLTTKAVHSCRSPPAPGLMKRKLFSLTLVAGDAERLGQGRMGRARQRPSMPPTTRLTARCGRPDHQNSRSGQCPRTAAKIGRTIASHASDWEHEMIVIAPIDPPAIVEPAHS
jgi:hypothetical protein